MSKLTEFLAKFPKGGADGWVRNDGLGRLEYRKDDILRHWIDFALLHEDPYKVFIAFHDKCFGSVTDA